MVTISSVVGSALGSLLGGVVRVAGSLRPAAKPLHPRGALRHAVLRRHGTEPPVGVPFLDEAGTDEVLIRESRATGLPRPLPDIHGLALRVPNSDGTVGDVLFATNGFGWLTRFLLVPTLTTYGRPMTTLLPYDTAAGPVLLGVRAVGQDRLALLFAVGEGPWREFGELLMSERESDDEISFDAVRNTLPGLRQYAAVRRLREPAYATARSTRGDE
jgi:hypothetical protein